MHDEHRASVELFESEALIQKYACGGHAAEKCAVRHIIFVTKDMVMWPAHQGRHDLKKQDAIDQAKADPDSISISPHPTCHAILSRDSIMLPATYTPTL